MSTLMPADGQMFANPWWAMPLTARYASIDAHKSGLVVQIEEGPLPNYKDAEPRITWRGTSKQFQKTKTFPNGVAAKRASGKYVHPGELRGTVYPAGNDEFVFVIEWCYTHTKLRLKQHVQFAMTDESYLNFRDAVMAGFPLQGIEVIND